MEVIVMYNTYIYKMFTSFKRGQLPAIQIFDQQTCVGMLRPITYDFQTSMPQIGALITKWKIANPSISNSLMAQITEDMTIQWIKKFVLAPQFKLLFLITDLNDTAIGYIGYASFNFDKKQCQLDSVLRGSHATHPGMMALAVKTLIEFGFQTLKLNNITLSTDSTNTHAITFYERIGFRQINRCPMQLIRVNQHEQRWIDNQSLTDSARWHVKMEYQR